jgi:hypothetical protein
MVLVKLDVDGIPIVTGDIPPNAQTPIVNPTRIGQVTNRAFIVAAGEYCYGLQSTVAYTPLWQTVQAIDGEQAEITFRRSDNDVAPVAKEEIVPAERPTMSAFSAPTGDAVSTNESTLLRPRAAAGSRIFRRRRAGRCRHAWEGCAGSRGRTAPPYHLEKFEPAGRAVFNPGSVRLRDAH